MSVISYFDMVYTPTTFAVTGIVFFSTFLLYKWLLPSPINGIPFNEEAVRSIFGDIPSMLNHLKTSKTFSDWVASHNDRHNNPIVQVFANLFRRPWVVISDFREAQDILMRRTKEFDKPDLIATLFWGINPDHHVIKVTNDEFRSQRKLMQDLMSPGFLHGVAAPQLHNNFMDLIKLWTEKSRLSGNRPFSMKHDVYETALEAIWAAVFGLENIATITQNQINLLSRRASIELPSAAYEAVDFPRAPPPIEFDAILKITDSLEFVLKSPFPYVTGFAQRYMPSTRGLLQLKDKVIKAQIQSAKKRLGQNKDNAGNITSAIDHMLRRETLAAERQKRNPGYESKVMIAELFGLLVAGHDTTSTTLLWAIRFLTADQNVQTKLRTSLHSMYPVAHTEDRVPNAKEIATTTNGHYLDACIEEIVRCCQTASLISRTAVTDAVVLGHVIPKGTMVLCCAGAGGVLKPGFAIDDALRSKSFHSADGGKTGAWEIENMDKFNPERWLVHNQDTNSKVFDSTAGPHLLFGAGPRGCFGRRLAYLELRLAIVLILWSFELQPLPEQYAGWEAMEQLTRSPVQCYVKLAKA